MSDSYNVVDGDPVIDNAAGTITMKIDAYDEAKRYHYVSPTFAYTNEAGDTWGITAPSLRITQVEAPAGPALLQIDRVENVVAGKYMMAGYSESYTSTTFAPYSWHFWTGTIAAKSAGSQDLNTVNYSIADGVMTINPNLSAQDAAKGTAAEMELVAVEGKTNVYYIKIGDKYLQCTGKRASALVADPVEWTLSNHEKGGIQLTCGSVILGTAGATYDMLRCYASPAASLVYGVAFFKQN
jgi:hypothetical protein